MTEKFNQRLLEKTRLISEGISIFVFTLGAAVLLGWIFDVSWLKSLRPAFATMKPITAISFSLAAFSLWLLQVKRLSATTKSIARICCLAVILAAIITLTEYIFKADILTSLKNRMSFATALNFLLTGAGLLFLDTKRQSGFKPSDIFILFVGIISLIAITGYAFDYRGLYETWIYSSMALHTAVAFFLLFFSMLFARPDRGVISIIMADTYGSYVVRRILPVIILLIILIYVVVEFFVHKVFLSKEPLDDAIAVILNIILAATMFFYSSKLLNVLEFKRKEAQELLQKAQKRYRLITETSLDGICQVDEAGRVIFLNNSFAKIFGYAKDEILNKHFSMLIEEKDREKTAKIFNAVISGEVFEGEFMARHKQGNKLSVYFSAVPIKEEDMKGVNLFAKDISAHKRMEAELLRNNERFALVTMATKSVAWDWDLSNNALWRDYMFCDVFKYDVNEVGSDIKSWTSRIHPDDLVRVSAMIYAVIERGDKTWKDEYRFRRGDGSYVWVEDHGYVIHDNARKPVRMIGAMMDITSRKEAEIEKKKQLHELEVFYKASVGREERILELKKEIERLKAKK